MVYPDKTIQAFDARSGSYPVEKNSAAICPVGVRISSLSATGYRPSGVTVPESEGASFYKP